MAQTLALKPMSEQQKTPFDILSKRELDILLKISKGLDAPTIGNQLCISPKTVNTYRYRIQEKLNIANDVQLTLLALRYGLLENMET